MATRSLPADVKLLSWAAEHLGIADSTAYRLAPFEQIPGAFKVGGQWRVSVPKFMHEVHGVDLDASIAAGGTAPSTEDNPGRPTSAGDDRGPTASKQKAETGGTER
jgi:hypothetical protein